MSMNNAVPRVKPHVRFRKEEFGGLIFTNRTPILAINNDSFLIWAAIDGKRTVYEIYTLLVQNSNDKQIDLDIVNDFLTACEELDLIEFNHESLP